MTDDQIRSLLHQADAGAALPLPRADLPGTIRRTIRRRRVIAVMAGSCAMLALATTIAIWRFPQPSRPIAHNQAPPAAQPSVPAVDLVALEAEARMHSEIADRLLAAERQRQTLALAATVPDPLDAINRQRNRTALLLVSRADQLLEDDQPTAAAAEYEQAARLFPDTQWAATARDRLARMERKEQI